MEDSFGISCIAVSLGLTTLYHAVFFGRVALTNSWNIQFSDDFVNNIIWVSKHQETHDSLSVVLAVQVLRNTTLAAIFVGSFAFQFGLSAVTLCAQSNQLEIKIGEGIVACFMFLSFLSWATVIRATVHLGFHIDTLSYLQNCVHLATDNVSNFSRMEGTEAFHPNKEDRSTLIKSINLKIVHCHRLLSFITIFFRFAVYHNVVIDCKLSNNLYAID